jgi:hypothetical protein
MLLVHPDTYTSSLHLNKQTSMRLLHTVLACALLVQAISIHGDSVDQGLGPAALFKREEKKPGKSMGHPEKLVVKNGMMGRAARLEKAKVSLNAFVKYVTDHKGAKAHYE